MDLVGQKGDEGGQHRHRLQQAVAQGREGGAVAFPEAPPREAHVPVGELLDVLGDRLAGAGAVEVVHPLADRRDRRLQPRQRPAVEVGLPVARFVSRVRDDQGTARCGGEVERAEVLGVGVENPEGVGVPERQQELAHRLADRLDREAVAGPGLLGRQVVPAEGVGAVGGDHVPGVDDVAAALRHLLALGVEDQAEADAVAEARLAEQQRRLGQQRVEPAAGLVLGLADVVGREALGKLLLVLERVVELRERHRAAVVPGVDHRLDPAHLAAAALAGKGDLVDVGAVQVELLGHRATRPLAQLGDRADAAELAAIRLLTAPDRQRRAPVAVAAERPVDVVLQPFAEAAVLDVLGVPADRLVVGQQLVLDLGGGDVPARGRVVEQRRAAAPAVGVGVLVDLLAEEQPALLEPGDQPPRHLRVLDEVTLEAEHAAVEATVEADRVVEGLLDRRVEDPVGGCDRVVVLAEGGGDVDEAGAVLGGDEIAGEDRVAEPPARDRRGRRTGPRSGGRPAPRRRTRHRGSRRPSPSTFSTSGRGEDQDLVARTWRA